MEVIADTQDELTRRHRAALSVVIAMAALTLLLAALALYGVTVPQLETEDPFLEGALRIAIIFCGLGAVRLRRARFAAARMQNIASLHGASGLLVTLQNTTVLVALLGGAAAVMGYVVASVTNSRLDVLMLLVVALVVLVNSFPRRSRWQRLLDAFEQAGVLPGAPSTKGPIA